MGQQELSPGLAHAHSPCALPATSGSCRCSPALAASLGTGCAWGPPSWPHISCQVFSKKYSRAMQGGSWDPPRFEQPLHPSWNCCHLSPRGPSAPRPVPARQQLLLNQRRGPGCAKGDCLSPCKREELGESRVPAPRAWGRVGSKGWQQGNGWGCRGSWKDPYFPKAWEGSLGVLVTCSPPQGVLRLSPCPPRASQLLPRATFAMGTTGCSPPLPGDPGRCPLLCRALPRSAPLPWWAPVPHPTRSTSRWDPQVRRPQGSVTGASTHAAACACLLPCSVSRRKKSNGNSLV